MSKKTPNSTKPKRTKKQKVRDRDIVGLKYFDQLAPLLQQLHDDGCERDTAGNRKRPKN